MGRVVTQEELDRGDILEDEEITIAEEEEEEENIDDDSGEEEELESEDDLEKEEDDADTDDEDEGEAPSDEEDEDPEDEGEDEKGEGEEESDKDEQKIPRARLNQVIEQRNKERDRVEWLEDQLEKMIEREPVKEEVKEEPVVQYDFDEAEGKYIELILEGETADAAKLRREINKENSLEVDRRIEKAQKSATEEAIQTTTASREKERFDTMVENYENKYDFLNAESDDYNEEAVDTVNTLMTGFMSQDMSQSKALKKAVERIAPVYDKEPEKKTLGGKKRKTTPADDRKRNAKASKQQPPKTEGKGSKTRDMDSLNIETMTDNEFNSLTDKEKKVLRGDI
jgi:hypothetical protein